MEKVIQLIQHLKSPNSINGNPKRLFIIYGLDTSFEGVWILPTKIIDEGYRGKPEGEFITLPDINITPKEYKKWKQYGIERGIFQHG